MSPVGSGPHIRSPGWGLRLTPDAALRFDIDLEGDRRIICVAGELDIATLDGLLAVATTGNHSVIVIDIADVTFMDRSGNRVIDASRSSRKHTANRSPSAGARGSRQGSP